MAMRLQELHPALVHYPLALLPATLGADAVGRITGNRFLLEVGRRGMPLAAGSAVVAGLAGLIAQEAVEVREEAHPTLTTHRNLNLGLTALTLVLANKRLHRTRPSWVYLLAGAAGLGVMAYSAYLGGHMVYAQGVGVKPAGGIKEGEAPEIRADNAGEVARLAAHHLEHGARHAWKHLREGEVAPTLTADHGKDQSHGAEPQPEQRGDPFYNWLDNQSIRELVHRANDLQPGERLVLIKGLVPGLVDALGADGYDEFMGELRTKGERYEEARTHPGEPNQAKQTPGEPLGGPVPEGHLHLDGHRDPDRPGGREAEREREANAFRERRGEP